MRATADMPQRLGSCRMLRRWPVIEGLSAGDCGAWLVVERSFVLETHWLDNYAQNFQTSVVKNPNQLRCGLECRRPSAKLLEVIGRQRFGLPVRDLLSFACGPYRIQLLPGFTKVRFDATYRDNLGPCAARIFICCFRRICGTTGCSRYRELGLSERASAAKSSQ